MCIIANAIEFSEVKVNANKLAIYFFYAPASKDWGHNYSFWPICLTVGSSAKTLTLAISFDW